MEGFFTDGQFKDLSTNFSSSHVCEQPHTISAAAAHSIHAALNTIFGPKYLDNRSSERFDMIRYVNRILRMLNKRLQV